MQIASVSQTKNSLSALLDQVKAGEIVVIMDRGVPVARIVPLSAREQGAGQRQRLERAGVLRRGTGSAREALAGTTAPVGDGHGRAAVEAVIAERRVGR